jgi:hypothetical protein
MAPGRDETRSLFLLVLASASAATIAGCTLIGVGIGSKIDSNTRKNAPPRALAGWQIVEVKEGSDVVVSLKDGRTLGGRYRGLQRGEPNQYVERYSRLADGDPALPRLGPGAKLTMADGTPVAGELIGLDPNAVWMVEGVSVRRWTLDGARDLRDGSGRVLEAAALGRRTSSMDVPLVSDVVVEVKDRAVRTPLDQVLQVSVPRSGHATLIGGLVGVAIDAAIVAATVGGSSSGSSSYYVSPSNEGKYGGSCPLVGSFDGSGWVLDSETFGGAIFPAAQRTDWDNLEHLAETDGAYRLRVSNGLPETQHVDQLRLLVVDHPRGSRVVPDFFGGLHRLDGPGAPLVARDLDGHDATALVAAADGRPWLSNPFGRDPEDARQVRDGLVLEFPAGAGLARADLLVRVRNTPFGDWLQKRLLELPGTALDRWYEELDRSAEARSRLQKAMIREGMIRVEVLARDGWREGGFVWEVGPLVWKDVVVPLDLSDVDGERVRVRLSATAGLWMVDRAALEPGSVLVEPDAELLPQRARDERGSDVLPLLLAADGRRYVMPDLENRADLSFAAPPPKPGWDRSVLLEATGYYLIHVPPGGEPQLELMERLVNEPGAYGRFALGLLRDGGRGARAGD